MPRKRKKNCTLTQRDVVQAVEHAEDDTVHADSGYSKNWRILAEEMGISSSRKHDKSKKPSRPKKLREATDAGHSRSTQSSHSEGTSHSSWKHDKSKKLMVGELSRRGTSSSEAGPSGTSKASIGDCISVDCEMVGGGTRGEINMLARCSIVNHRGNVIYDKYVAPTSRVWDYRTCISGIRPHHLHGAPEFSTVQREVADLMKGRVLVGHDLKHDLQALSLAHPRKDTRDTSTYKPFKDMFGGRTPSLRNLAKKILDQDIQSEEHDSIEDACVTMRLYQRHKKEWDKHAREGGGYTFGKGRKSLKNRLKLRRELQGPYT